MAEEKEELHAWSRVKTNLAALLLALACSVLIGIAQFGLKWSANRLRTDGLFDPQVLALIFLSHLVLGAGLLVYLLALRHGELSTIYPVLAARYIWIVLLSAVFFPAEALNLYKIAGAGLAAVGVAVVARGGLR